MGRKPKQLWHFAVVVRLKRKSFRQGGRGNVSGIDKAQVRAGVGGGDD